MNLVVRPHVSNAKFEQHLNEMLLTLGESNAKIASYSSAGLHFDEALSFGLGLGLTQSLRQRRKTWTSTTNTSTRTSCSGLAKRKMERGFRSRCPPWQVSLADSELFYRLSGLTLQASNSKTRPSRCLAGQLESIFTGLATIDGVARMEHALTCIIHVDGPMAGRM